MAKLRQDDVYRMVLRVLGVVLRCLRASFVSQTASRLEPDETLMVDLDATVDDIKTLLGR